VRSATEWAQVKALAADGVWQREVAARLGINRRTVKRPSEAEEAPRYRCAPAGSILDPFEGDPPTDGRLALRQGAGADRGVATRPLRLPRDGPHAGGAARGGSVEGAVRYLNSRFWPARRFGSLGELGELLADWRNRVAPPRDRPPHRR
jgi:hypothetical protein